MVINNDFWNDVSEEWFKNSELVNVINKDVILKIKNESLLDELLNFDDFEDE